jgi:hypothetical protein
MNDVAIRVESLGKRYRIGARQEAYGTLKEALARVLEAPRRAWRGRACLEPSGGESPIPARQSAEHGAREPALQGSRYRIAWRPGAAQDSRPRHPSWRVRKPSPGAGADLAVPNLLRTTSMPSMSGSRNLLARLQCHSTRRILSGCQVRRSRIPAAADRGHRASATGCAMRGTGSCLAHHPVHPPEALDAAGADHQRPA